MSAKPTVTENIVGTIALLSLLAGFVLWYEDVLSWWMALVLVSFIWVIAGSFLETSSDKPSEWMLEQYRLAEEELRAQGLLDDEDERDKSAVSVDWNDLDELDELDELDDQDDSDEWEESKKDRRSDEERHRYHERIDGELIVGHRYKLDYTDFHGKDSERVIVLHDVLFNVRGDMILEAFCESRGEMRSFKLRNVNELIDLDTGDELI